MMAAILLLTACSVQDQPIAASPTLEVPAETELSAVEQVPMPTIEVVPTVINQIPVEALRNATYSGIYDEPITLTDGTFEESIDGQLISIEYIDNTELFADLDGDGIEDAIVFLIERGGGTAAFTYVAAQLNHNGQPVDAGAAMVEDRTQFRSVAVQDGKILLGITTRGPGDGDCCPSHKTRKTYTLEDRRLVEVPGWDQELVKISTNDLNGTSWTLLEFDPDEPVLADSEVSISFEGNKLSGSGGCNSYTSSFSLGDPNPFIMTIEPIAATQKACPDPILKQETAYFSALENVSLWGYRFGQLVLAYADGDDSGLKWLLFAPQEAPKTVQVGIQSPRIETRTQLMNLKPDYIAKLEASYGTPSQSGFGSAVFFEQVVRSEELERTALDKYKYFVGELWERYGEDAWMGPWKQVYTRQTGTKHDIVAELRGIQDSDAALSVPMILDNIEGAEKAREALSTAFDDPSMTELLVYNLGDGGAMSGILVAGRRSNGETTYLVFLSD
jgi:heat shock protein HslJ